MTELIKALIKLQDKLPELSLDGKVEYGKTSFRYSKLPNIVRTVKPFLKECGFAFTQVLSEGSMKTILFHISGDKLVSYYPLPDVTNPQDLGKWMTYIKRYELAAILGLVAEEDDDGQVSGPAKKKTVPEGVRLAVEEKLESLKTTDQVKAYWLELKERHGDDPVLKSLVLKRGQEIKS